MDRKISHWKVTFIVPHTAADAFCDALENAFRPETFAITTSEAEPGSSPLVQTSSEWNEVEARGAWRLEALYLEEPEIDAIRDVLKPVEKETGIAASDLSVEAVPEEDWIAKSLEGLQPVQAGRFFVYGSHDADKVPASGIPILIEAGRAFGTGHHATTQGCLEFINRYLKRQRPLNPLDLGTGTGVLAIAIARVTHEPVLASDIDPISVKVTNDNAKLNGVGPFVKAVAAKGFDHPEISANAPYDLIVANILARPLVSLMPGFAWNLAAGGTLILSGILRTQENMVLAAARMQEMYLVSRKPIGDWVTLELRG
ncbi:50S ribosomal protein L11 methyltransferase [Parvibaculum sp. MBR-TMA-1.3b-4.2]|jgi:ribosomal protein L11 methyltransferase